MTGSSDDAKIRPISEAPARLTDAALIKIETYWSELRRGRLVPDRAEIDPRALEGVLGHTFILEQLSPTLARFRLAGSHLSAVTGLELRQMPVSVLFSAAARPVLADALRAAFDEPAHIRMGITSKGGFAQGDLTGEMVLLPLRSDTGDVTRILGGLSLHGDVGAKPRRIDITRQSRKTLTGYAGESVVPTRVAPAATAPRPISRDHLKLVIDNG